jgi:hypothetical protein
MPLTYQPFANAPEVRKIDKDLRMNVADDERIISAVRRRRSDPCSAGSGRCGTIASARRRSRAVVVALGQGVARGTIINASTNAMARGEFAAAAAQSLNNPSR